MCYEFWIRIGDAFRTTQAIGVLEAVWENVRHSNHRLPTTQVENDVRLSRKKPKGVGAWKLPTPEAHGSGCSPDARGNRTEVEAELGGEHFTKAGVVISDRGWLEVHRGGNCDLPKWRATVVFCLSESSL